MFSPAVDSGPAVVVRYDKDEKKVVCSQPIGQQVIWDYYRMRDETVATLYMALTESGAVPERLIYAFASKVFCTTIPRPIGGKRAPGFLSFAGASAEELLIWIIEKAITSPTRRGRGKPLDPGDLLTMVVGFFNEVLTLHRSGSKDDLDNAVLRGMRRAGHLVNTGSRTILPPHLRGDADSSSFPQTPEQQHPNVSLGGSAVSGSRGTQEVFSSFVGMMDAPAERRQQHTNDVANASNHAIADRPPNSAYSDRGMYSPHQNSSLMAQSAAAAHPNWGYNFMGSGAMGAGHNPALAYGAATTIDHQQYESELTRHPNAPANPRHRFPTAFDYSAQPDPRRWYPHPTSTPDSITQLSPQSYQNHISRPEETHAYRLLPRRNFYGDQNIVDVARIPPGPGSRAYADPTLDLRRGNGVRTDFYGDPPMERMPLPPQAHGYRSQYGHAYSPSRYPRQIYPAPAPPPHYPAPPIPSHASHQTLHFTPSFDAKTYTAPPSRSATGDSYLPRSKIPEKLFMEPILVASPTPSHSSNPPPETPAFSDSKNQPELPTPSSNPSSDLRPADLSLDLNNDKETPNDEVTNTSVVATTEIPTPAPEPQKEEKEDKDDLMDIRKGRTLEEAEVEINRLEDTIFRWEMAAKEWKLKERVMLEEITILKSRRSGSESPPLEMGRKRARN